VAGIPYQIYATRGCKLHKTDTKGVTVWTEFITTLLHNPEDLGLDSSSTRKEPVEGSCEHSNESSGPIKGMEFLD